MNNNDNDAYEHFITNLTETNHVQKLEKAMGLINCASMKLKDVHDVLKFGMEMPGTHKERQGE
ncbi:MAG: hypothetical protein RIF33_03625 [Cyclobacteriaceae bacterium]